MAALNREKNDGPVGQLRNHWAAFQSVAQVEKTAAEYPDVTELQSRLAAMRHALVGLDRDVADSMKAIREMEDKIFAINRPQKHRYVIERLSADAP